MKIRTPRLMSRVALLSTVTLATVAATLAFPGTAQAEFGLSNTKASVGTMQQSVISQMQGTAFGWQLAIAKDGELKVADKRGWRSRRPTPAATRFPCSRQCAWSSRVSPRTSLRSRP